MFCVVGAGGRDVVGSVAVTIAGVELRRVRLPLPGFTLPGDLSGSSRYFTRDVTAPFVPVAGRLSVPTGPGLGIVPDRDALAALTTSVEPLRP